MKTTLRLASVLVASVTVVAGLAASGSARVDTAGPTLHAALHPRFDVGQPLVEVGRRGLTGLGGAPVILRSRQTDSSGVCSQIVKALLVGDFPRPLANLTYPHEVELLNTVASFYDGEQGGNSQRTVGWVTKSTDCAGNTSRWFTSASTAISDDAGAGYASGHTSIASPTFKGKWRGRSDAKLVAAHYVEGTLHVAADQGASASVKVKVDRGSHFGLVMPTAAGAGTVEVRVDGILRRTVDLTSSEPRAPRIVADVRLTAGPHTISVRKSSEDGWVGIDAFMLTSGVVLLGGPVPGRF